VGLCDPSSMLSTWASNGVWRNFSMGEDSNVIIENIYDNVYPVLESLVLMLL
jgi:hypothetical protein